MKLDNQKLGLNLPQKNGLKRQLLIEIVGSFRSSVQLDNSRCICIFPVLMLNVVSLSQTKVKPELKLIWKTVECLVYGFLRANNATANY